MPPTDTEPIRESSIEIQPVAGSILDIVSMRVRNDFGAVGEDLADLLPPPGTFGEFALQQIVVDDPNGNGRIDGRWYPPRIKRSDCATAIDSAPVPTAAASYIPGRPSEVYSGASSTQALELFGNDETIGITIQVLDEAAQRDELFAVVDEQYRTGFQVNCELAGTQDLVEATRVDPLDTHPGSSVYAVKQLGFDGFVALVPFGDRVLLTVSVGEGIGGGGGATPDRSDLEAVASLQLERLGAATLP